MSTKIKLIGEDMSTYPTPENGNVIIGLDIDGVIKIKNENNNINIINDNSPIEITYKNLKSLYDNSNLTVGKFYKIIDYQTIHCILDGGFTQSGDINIGSTESIILTATSESTFDKQVYSTEYPNDIIEIGSLLRIKKRVS